MTNVFSEEAFINNATLIYTYPTVKVKQLDPLAQLPHSAHKDDAGADIFSIESVDIPPQKRVAVRTGIAIENTDRCLFGHDGLFGHTVADLGSGAWAAQPGPVGGIFQQGCRRGAIRINHADRRIVCILLSDLT